MADVNFKPGDQIAYIPDHVHGDLKKQLKHSDVEFGFVMTVWDNRGIFCRYWQPGNIGVLRTTSCSELTYERNLVQYVSTSNDIIQKTMQQIQKNKLP